MDKLYLKVDDKIQTFYRLYYDLGDKYFYTTVDCKYRLFESLNDGVYMYTDDVGKYPLQSYDTFKDLTSDYIEKRGVGMYIDFGNISNNIINSQDRVVKKIEVVINNKSFDFFRHKLMYNTGYCYSTVDNDYYIYNSKRGVDILISGRGCFTIESYKSLTDLVMDYTKNGKIYLNIDFEEDKEDKIQFQDILDEMLKIYQSKNSDYGSSFDKSLDEYGVTAGLIRMEDKMNRLKTLTKNEQKVKDESIEDTLIDLANYSIMTCLYLRNKMEGVDNDN